MKTKIPDFNRIIFTVIFILILIPLVVTFISTIESLNQTLRTNIEKLFIPIVFYSGLLIIFLYLVKSEALEKNDEKKFLIWTLVSAFLLGLISIIWLDSQLVSDFKSYHNNAVRIINGEMTDHWENVSSPYIKRALFYLVPIYTLFGESQFAAEIFNLLFHLASGLFIYLLIRDSFDGNTIPRVAMIILLTYPIMLLMLNITNHDIPGLFYLSGYFFFFKRIYENVKTVNWLRIAIFVLLASFFLIMSQLVRNIGIVLVLCSFLYVALFIVGTFKLSDPKKNLLLYGKMAAFMFILPFLIYRFGIGLAGDNSKRNLDKMMLLYTDTKPTHSGQYSSSFDYKWRFYPQIDELDYKSKIGYGKLYSELYYNYYDFISLMVRKMSRLYSIGNDYSWTVYGSDKSPAERGLIKEMNQMHRLLLFFFGIAGLFFVLRKISITDPASIIFLAWFFLGNALLFSEVQPRYSYIFHIPLAIFGAAGFVNLFRKQADTERGKLLNVIYGIIILLILLVFFKYFSRIAFGGSEKLYLNAGSYKVTSPKGISGVVIKNKYPQDNPMTFGINLPSDDEINKFTVTEWKFDKNPGYYFLSTFLSTDKDIPNGAKISFTLNDTLIYSNMAKRIGGPERKITKGYLARYIKSDTLYLNGLSSLKLIYEMTDPREKYKQDDSKILMDFTQILKSDEAPKKEPGTEYLPPEVFTVKWDNIAEYNASNDLFNPFAEKEKIAQVIENGKLVINVSQDPKSYSRLITGGEGGYSVAPEIPEQYMVEGGALYRLSIVGKHLAGAKPGATVFLFDGNRRIEYISSELDDKSDTTTIEFKTPKNANSFRLQLAYNKTGKSEISKLILSKAENIDEILEEQEEISQESAPVIEISDNIVFPSAESHWSLSSTDKASIKFEDGIEVNSNAGSSYTYLLTGTSGSVTSPQDLPFLMLKPGKQYKAVIDAVSEESVSSTIWIIFYDNSKKVGNTKAGLKTGENVIDFKFPENAIYYKIGVRISGNGKLKINSAKIDILEAES
jgi:hypothetical protein